MSSAQSFVSRRDVRRYYHAECHAEEATLGFHSPIYFSFVFFTIPTRYVFRLSWLVLALIFLAVKRHDFVAVAQPSCAAAEQSR